MKITNITQEGNIYTVTFTPSWLEKLFGCKKRSEKYKDTGDIYQFGGGHAYIRQDGSELGNLNNIRKEIDKWRRKW